MRRLGLRVKRSAAGDTVGFVKTELRNDEGSVESGSDRGSTVTTEALIGS